MNLFKNIVFSQTRWTAQMKWFITLSKSWSVARMEMFVSVSNRVRLVVKLRDWFGFAFCSIYCKHSLNTNIFGLLLFHFTLFSDWHQSLACVAFGFGARCTIVKWNVDGNRRVRIFGTSRMKGQVTSHRWKCRTILASWYMLVQKCLAPRLVISAWLIVFRRILKQSRKYLHEIVSFGPLDFISF